MVGKKFLCQVVTLASLLSATSLAQAESFNTKDVVRDSRGNIVRSIAFGTCVRTKTDIGQDLCAVETASAQTVRPLHTEFHVAERTIYFPFNSARIVDSEKQKLDNIARTLSAATDVKSADIVGFADRLGSSSYNNTLSKRRAKAVKDYLTSRGYLNTNLAEIRGLGKSQPVTKCNGIKNRQKLIECLGADRRVEVEIKYNEVTAN